MISQDKAKRPYAQHSVFKVKKKYNIGTRIKLIKMYHIEPLPKGSKGTIDFIDEVGTIYMKWDNGSSLKLIAGVDEFEIIKE